MGAGAKGPYGERNTNSVCDCHDLGAFPFLSRSNTSPPFLALAKVPSIKHSVMSIFPRSRRSDARACSSLSQEPLLHQCLWYRWQVWYGGYLPGRSAHGAPVRHIHKIPLSTARGSCLGLPRVSLLWKILVSGFSNTSHCLSLMSIAFLSEVHCAKEEDQLEH